MIIVIINMIFSLLHGVFSHLRLTDIAVAAIGLFIYRSIIQRLRSKGPMLWPVFGIAPSLLCNVWGNLYEWCTDSLISAGGTFEFRGMAFGKLYGAMTLDPANIEYILKSRFTNFPKGPYYHERFQELLGNGIFNADDALWQEQRFAAKAEMHSARFVRYSESIMQELVHGKLLPLLENLAETGGIVDLQDLFLRFTFDNICSAAFGLEVGCLAPDLPNVPFADAFEEATQFSLLRFTIPPLIWKSMRKLDIGTERRLRLAVETVHEFAENTVAGRRAELRKLQGGISGRSDLLSRLMEADETNKRITRSSLDKFQFTDKFLKDFCISFILAGRDTSSVALAWFFWLLHNHPHVEQKIINEINSIISARNPDDEIINKTNNIVFTADELKRMDYLQAALSESLRLYPSVPIDFKQVREDDVLPDGTRVRKGARMMYSIYSMGRSEFLWGKDCREFKPERWIRDGAFVNVNQFKYAVFNAGPRLCIGKRFAYMQMKMVASSVLLRYRVEVLQGQVVVPKVTTTLYMKNGLQVRFKSRDAGSVLIPTTTAAAAVTTASM